VRERLTKLVVDGLKSQAKDLIVWDRDLKGFGVNVTPSGKKVYFTYYRQPSDSMAR
jgi:hypothetical protein